VNEARAVSAPLSLPALLVGGLALVFVALASTVLTMIASDASVVVGLAPVVMLAGLWIIWTAPLRRTLFILIFFCLALDKPGDTEGLWRSPLAALGGLLLNNINKTVNIPPLTVSLLILLLALLMVVRGYRALYQPWRDGRAGEIVGRPMTWALVASLLAAAGLVAYGVASGGDPQMAKIQLQVFVPLLAMAYLLGTALRGVRDYRVLAVIVVTAACIKALVAVWIRLTLPVVFGEGRGQMPYATTHGDSMLFAAAAAILIAALFERPIRRNLGILLAVMPILVAGMLANNRRLVWVELGVSLGLMLAMNPRGRATRGLIRAAIYGLPIILLYVAIGWNSGSKVFAPVQTLRSMSDSDIDRSTLYRDSENYNLVHTFQSNPIVGTGFGHPFELFVKLDDISTGFKEWRYLPHNSILGLWAFTGGVGFSLLWIAIAVGMLLAARSYQFAERADHRIAAAGAMAAIVIYIIHCWGDIGFTEQKSIFLVGAALAVAGQLAVATGAWRVRPSIA